MLRRAVNGLLFSSLTFVFFTPFALDSGAQAQPAAQGVSPPSVSGSGTGLQAEASAPPAVAPPPTQMAPALPSNNIDCAALLSGITMTGWVPTEPRDSAVGPSSYSASNQANQNTQALDDTKSLNNSMLGEFGLIKVTARTYQRGQRQIIASVYQFRSSDGAYGAYNLLRHGASTVLLRGDASSEDDQSISFLKGPYFIEVVGTSQDDEESKEAVRYVADQLSHAIRDHADLPAMLSRIPFMDRVRGSEKLVMGPVSARRFFPAPFLTSLMLTEIQGAVVADYQFQYPSPERMKLLYIDYRNPQVASRAYLDYGANFEDRQQIGDEDRRGMSSLYKVAGTFVLCQLRGQQIILISGGRKKYAPMMLARQVN